MKKLLLAFVLFAIANTSCNQQNQNQMPPVPLTGNVSYTINGATNIAYTTTNSFSKSNLNCGNNSFVASDQSVIGRSVMLSLYTDNFGQNTYLDTASVACNKKQLTFIIYENEKPYSNKYWIPQTVGKNSTDTWLKITSITANSISGIFACRLINPNGEYTDTLNITNGKFDGINYLTN